MLERTGDIDVGDSFGSVLTQITLILGLVALFRVFQVKRREILVVGAFEILALGVAIAVAVTGFTREKALLLIAMWPVFIYLIKRLTAKDMVREEKTKARKERHYLYHLVVAVAGYIGVGIGSIAVIQ